MASDPQPQDGIAMDPVVMHCYVSTYCQHSLHDRCRLRCKMCAAPCLCHCHIVERRTTFEEYMS